MNVFEDLIEELKHEDLIETTIFDSANEDTSEYSAIVLEQDSGSPTEKAAESVSDERLELAESDSSDDGVDPVESARKSAMDEISGLQMVGHILSGIELAYMEKASLPYDDLSVKKALSEYLETLDELGSDAHEQARAELYRQNEAWYSALADRDKGIKLEHLRSFCENSKPVLSSKAIIALARFYRNAPFSEDCRKKFDYVMTRLFSKELGDCRRKLLFGKVEMVGHINTLYSNWSSLSMYSADEYSGIVREHSFGFSEYAAEAEIAATVDDLISSDIIERSAETKKNLADMFFTSEILAASIDFNLRLGNKFVSMVRDGIDSSGEESVRSTVNEDVEVRVSNAIGRTLTISEIIESTPVEDIEPAEVEKVRERPKQRVVYEKVPVENRAPRGSLLSVNKWLLASTLLVIAVSVGLYFWADQYERTQTVGTVAPDLSLAGSGLERYLKSAKKSSETVYAVTMPDWDVLEESGQKRVLQDALQYSVEKGAKKVQFMNGKGRTVGFAADGRVDLYPH